MTPADLFREERRKLSAELNGLRRKGDQQFTDISQLQEDLDRTRQMITAIRQALPIVDRLIAEAVAQENAPTFEEVAAQAEVQRRQLERDGITGLPPEHYDDPLEIERLADRIEARANMSKFERIRHGFAAASLSVEATERLVSLYDLSSHTTAVDDELVGFGLAEPGDEGMTRATDRARRYAQALHAEMRREESP